MSWNPPVELSPIEETICGKLTRTGRFYAFLRRVRTQLFDDDFQMLLMGLFASDHAGTEPAPPAQVALMLLLHGYAKVSDDEAIRRAQIDDAWKMVLATLGQNDSPVCKATLSTCAAV